MFCYSSSYLFWFFLQGKGQLKDTLFMLVLFYITNLLFVSISTMTAKVISLGNYYAGLKTCWYRQITSRNVLYIISMQ